MLLTFRGTVLMEAIKDQPSPCHTNQMNGKDSVSQTPYVRIYLKPWIHVMFEFNLQKCYIISFSFSENLKLQNPEIYLTKTKQEEYSACEKHVGKIH